jgi:hypothetical protein
VALQTPNSGNPHQREAVELVMLGEMPARRPCQFFG